MKNVLIVLAAMLVCALNGDLFAANTVLRSSGKKVKNKTLLVAPAKASLQMAMTFLPGWRFGPGSGPQNGVWKQTGGSLASGNISYQCTGEQGTCTEQGDGGVWVNGNPNILFPVDPLLPVNTLVQ